MNTIRSSCGRGALVLRLATLVVILLGMTSAALAGTLVNMDFGALGSLNVDLFDDVAPATVANFLNYVNAGRYSNTIIHRALDQNVNGIGVVQGGGYDPSFNPIPTFAPIPLEYHLSNSLGTLGAARTAVPNSATSQWFFNSSDNSGTLGPPNGGGYAVFGWIVNPGGPTLGNIDAVPTYNFNATMGQSFMNLPLQNYTPQDYSNGVDPIGHTVVLNGVSIVRTHPSFQNPINRFDVNNDGLETPFDRLLILNDLANNGPHPANASYVGSTYRYLDTNGDGQVSELDLVPEPSSVTLAACGAMLLALALRRRRRRMVERVV
jgi:cyclophilin family peptidyl-prolyl cis-trans isomerase